MKWTVRSSQLQRPTERVTIKNTQNLKVEGPSKGPKETEGREQGVRRDGSPTRQREGSPVTSPDPEYTVSPEDGTLLGPLLSVGRGTDTHRVNSGPHHGKPLVPGGIRCQGPLQSSFDKVRRTSPTFTPVLPLDSGIIKVSLVL